MQDSAIYYAPSFTALQEVKKARIARAAGPTDRVPGSQANSAAQPGRSLTLLSVGILYYPTDMELCEAQGS
jgi:hypothetical protein